MQVESAVALKLLSGGCSLDMSKVICSSNFDCLPVYVSSSHIFLKNNFTILLLFCIILLSEWIMVVSIAQYTIRIARYNTIHNPHDTNRRKTHLCSQICVVSFVSHSELHESRF